MSKKSRPRVPRSVVVSGVRIPVLRVSSAKLSSLGGDSKEELAGLWKESERRIYLEDSLEGDQLRRVLVHEMYHAALCLSGLNALIDGNAEEALCLMMERFAEELEQLG